MARIMIVAPEVFVLKTDHITNTGVTSAASLKFVYPDDLVAYVHLSADQAHTLAAMLLLVAADIAPELVR